MKLGLIFSALFGVSLCLETFVGWVMLLWKSFHFRLYDPIIFVHHLSFMKSAWGTFFAIYGWLLLFLQYFGVWRHPSLLSFGFSEEKGLSACWVPKFFSTQGCDSGSLTVPREPSEALMWSWTSLHNSSVQLDRFDVAQCRAESPEPGFRSENS